MSLLSVYEGFDRSETTSRGDWYTDLFNGSAPYYLLNAVNTREEKTASIGQLTFPRNFSNFRRNLIGISKGEIRDACSLSFQFSFIIMQLLGNIWPNTRLPSHRWGWHFPLGKSWIHHCQILSESEAALNYIAASIEYFFKCK